MKILLLILFSAISCDGAYLFTISGELFGCTTSDSLNAATNTQTITVAGWATMRANIQSGSVIHCKGFVANNGTGLWTIENEGGQIGFQYDNPQNTAHLWLSTASIYTDTWTPVHVVFTFNYGTGSSMKCYVNGISIAGTWTAGNGNSAAIVNTDGLSISRRNVAAKYWSGDISEISMWDVVLNQNQINTLYNSRVKGICKQIRPDHLKLYMPLDESALFSKAIDRSGNVNNTSSSSSPSPKHVDERWMSYIPNE